LLVLNFPNGGSTAFAKLLLTAPGTIRLHENAEGHWLLPTLCADKLRWDPELAFDPAEVRDVWTRTAWEQCQLVGIRSDEALVIEKSPHNMCRYRRLLSAARRFNCLIKSSRLRDHECFFRLLLSMISNAAIGRFRCHHADDAGA
jgi:hypothetical protein